MAINTATANSQADQLRSYEAQLSQAQTGLREYQSRIAANWHAEEATLLSKAIDKVLSEMNRTINQLGPLSQNIKNAAEQIRCEEEAAAILAKKQEQIRKAKVESDTANTAAENLKKKLEELIKIAASRHKGAAGAVYIAADQTAIANAQRAFDEAAQLAVELQNRLNQLSR